MVIELLDGVTVLAPVGAALECCAHPQWVVEHGVRQVEEERALLVLLDKSDGLVGVGPGQFCRINGTLDNRVIAQQGDTSLIFEIDDLNRVKVVQ